MTDNPLSGWSRPSITLYKLTDENDQTCGGCQWGENVTVETSGEGELCSEGWTHWYTHPLLAVLFTTIHGNYDLDKAHLWKGRGQPMLRDSLKIGCKRATTLRRIDLPVVTEEQRVRFAILCARRVYEEESFLAWALGWLSGKDRTWESAEAALQRVWAVEPFPMPVGPRTSGAEATSALCTAWTSLPGPIPTVFAVALAAARWARPRQGRGVLPLTVAATARAAQAGLIDLISIAREAVGELDAYCQYLKQPPDN